MYTTKDAIMAYAALTQRQQPTDSASLFADYFSICKQYSDTPVARETHQMYVKRVDHLRELLRQQRLKKPLLHKPDAPAAGDSLRPVSSSSNMNNNNSMSRGSSRGNASLVSDTSRSPPTLTGITAVTKRLGGNHNEEGDTNSTNNGMEASLNSAEGTEANAQGDLLSPGSSLSRRSTTSAGGVSTRTTAHMVNSFSNSLSTGTATEASLKNVSGSQRNTASSYVILRSEWGPEYYREQLFKPWNAFVDTLAEELVGTVLTWVTDCEGSDTWNSLVRVSPNCCYDRVHGMCLLRWNTLKEVKNYVEAAHSVINASMSLFFTPLTIGLEVLGQSVLCLSLAPVSSPWVDWLEAYPVQHAFQAMCASLRLLKPLKPSEMTQVSGGDDASSPLGRPVNGFHKPARETNGESGTEGEKKFSVFFSNATLENIASHVDNIRGGARRLRGNEMRGRNFTNTRLHAFLVASGADARWYMLDARALCYFQNYSRASYTAALVPRPEMYSSPVGVLMRDCGPNEFILHSKLTNIVAQLLNGVSSENSILVSTICHSHGVHFGSYVFPLLDLLKTEEKQLTASLQNSQRNGGSSPAVQARLSQCSKCCQGIIGELIARVIKSLLMQEWHNLTRAVDPQWVLRMRRSLSSVEGKRELYKAYKGGLGGSATPEVSLPLNGNTATSNNNSDVSFEDDYLVDFLRELSELDQPLLDKYLHLLDGIFRVGVGEDAAASYDGTSPGVSNTSFSNTAISRFSKNTAIGDGSGFSFGRNGTAKGNRLTYPAFNSALFSIQFREDMFEELLTIVNDVYVYRPYLAGEKAEEWQVLKKKPVVQLRRARDNNNRGSNNGNHAGRYDTSDDDKIRVKHNELYAGWTLQCLQEMLAVPLVLRNNSITVDRRSGDSKVLEPLLFGKTDKGRYPLRARSKLFRNTIEIPLVLKLGSIEKMQEYSYEQNEIGLRVASIPYHMGPGTSTDKNLHYARSGKYIQMYAADIRIACRGWMVAEDFDFMQQNNIGGAGRTRGYRPSAARQGSLMGRRRGADNPFNIGAVDDTRSRSAFLLYTSFRQCYLNGKSDLPEALTALWQFNEQTEALCEGSNTLSYLLRLKVSLLANMGSNYAASIITRGLESAASDLDVLTGGVLNRRYLSSNSPGNSHNASNTRPENGNFHDRGNSSISDSTGSWARELYHPSTHAALRNNGASVSAQSTSTEAMLNPLLPEYEESIPILQYNTTVKAEKVSELRPIQCGELFFALLTLLVKHMFVVDPQRSERESWKRAVQFCGVRREIVVVCYGEHSVEAAIAMNDLALLLLQVPETYSQAKEELLKAERNLQGYLWFLRTQLKGEEGAEIDGSNNTTQILAVESRKRSSSTQIIDNGSSNPHRADGNIALVLPVSNSLELGNKSRSGRDGLLPTGINNNDSLGSLSATTNFKNRLLIFRSFDQMRGDDNRIPFSSMVDVMQSAVEEHVSKALYSVQNNIAFLYCKEARRVFVRHREAQLRAIAKARMSDVITTVAFGQRLYEKEKQRAAALAKLVEKAEATLEEILTNRPKALLYDVAVALNNQACMHFYNRHFVSARSSVMQSLTIIQQLMETANTVLTADEGGRAIMAAAGVVPASLVSSESPWDGFSPAMGNNPLHDNPSINRMSNPTAHFMPLVPREGKRGTPSNGGYLPLRATANTLENWSLAPGVHMASAAGESPQAQIRTQRYELGEQEDIFSITNTLATNETPNNCRTTSGNDQYTVGVFFHQRPMTSVEVCRMNALNLLHQIEREMNWIYKLRAERVLKRYLVGWRERRRQRRIEAALLLRRVGAGALTRVFLARRYRYSGYYFWMRRPRYFMPKLEKTLGIAIGGDEKTGETRPAGGEETDHNKLMELPRSHSSSDANLSPTPNNRRHTAPVSAHGKTVPAVVPKTNTAEAVRERGKALVDYYHQSPALMRELWEREMLGATVTLQRVLRGYKVRSVLGEQNQFLQYYFRRSRPAVEQSIWGLMAQAYGSLMLHWLVGYGLLYMREMKASVEEGKIFLISAIEALAQQERYERLQIHVEEMMKAEDIYRKCIKGERKAAKDEFKLQKKQLFGMIKLTNINSNIVRQLQDVAEADSGSNPTNNMILSPVSTPSMAPQSVPPYGPTDEHSDSETNLSHNPYTTVISPLALQNREDPPWKTVLAEAVVTEQNMDNPFPWSTPLTVTVNNALIGRASTESSPAAPLNLNIAANLSTGSMTGTGGGYFVSGNPYNMNNNNNNGDTSGDYNATNNNFNLTNDNQANEITLAEYARRDSCSSEEAAPLGLGNNNNNNNSDAYQDSEFSQPLSNDVTSSTRRRRRVVSIQGAFDMEGNELTLRNREDLDTAFKSGGGAADELRGTNPDLEDKRKRVLELEKKHKQDEKMKVQEALGVSESSTSTVGSAVRGFRWRKDPNSTTTTSTSNSNMHTLLQEENSSPLPMHDVTPLSSGNPLSGYNNNNNNAVGGTSPPFNNLEDSHNPLRSAGQVLIQFYVEKRLLPLFVETSLQNYKQFQQLYFSLYVSSLQDAVHQQRQYMLLLQEYTARQALLESEVLSFVELNLLKLHHTYGTRQLEKYKVWGLNSARQLLSYYHQLRQYEQEVLHHVQGKIATTVREDPNKTAVTAAPADSPVENGGKKKKVVKKTIVVKKVKKSKKENGDDAPGSS